MALWLLASAAATGAPAEPVPYAAKVAAAAARWQPSLEAFAAADRAQMPAPGGLLFVGSSSIRLWSRVAQDFREAPVVVNRGFGGSTLADCAHLVRQLVLPYQPRQLVLYAGENDLADGRSPAEVLQRFQAFVVAVRSELPATRIHFIAIKPSPARVHLLPQVREANALVAAYMSGLSDAVFIDVHTPMLDAAGAPRGELFGPDRLHMNEVGYALWRSLVAPHVLAPAPVAASGPEASAAGR